MGTFQKFEDTEAWKKARQLTKEVYLATKSSGFSRDYRLRDQIRDAARSAMANIAEGLGRGGDLEFIQFLSIAKGSANEVRSDIFLALDVGYLEPAAFAELHALAVDTDNLIGGLIAYLRRSKLRGSKFVRSLKTKDYGLRTRDYGLGIGSSMDSGRRSNTTEPTEIFILDL